MTASSLAAAPRATAPGGAVRSAAHPGRAEVPSFEDVYDETFDFVWRNARRLGVPEAQVDDAVQETYLVVHRRLEEFEGRSALRTWIFGVLVRVAADHRRSHRRKSPHARGEAVDPDTLADATDGPHERAARGEGVRLLHQLLDELDDERRAVFVLAELEQMSAPDIAEALGENVNTVYARLRAARQQFEAAALRERARDQWRLR